MESQNSHHSPSPQKTGIGKFFIRTIYEGLSAITPIGGVIFLVIYCLKALSHVGSLLSTSLKDFATVIEFESSDTLTRLENALSHPWVLVLLPIFCSFMLGLLIKSTFGGFCYKICDRLLLQLPGITLLYSSLKQFVRSISDLGGNQKFKSVAYVEYPSPGCRLLGFVTGSYFDETTQKDVTTIFVPTSPNPATGFVLVVDNDKVIHSPLSLEEAGKLVLSAGLVHPPTEHLKNSTF